MLRDTLEQLKPVTARINAAAAGHPMTGELGPLPPPHQDPLQGKRLPRSTRKLAAQHHLLTSDIEAILTLKRHRPHDEFLRYP
jgi:hypothetical protein